MRRSEVDILVKNLLDAIDECEIPEIIDSIIAGESEMDAETALDSFRKFLGMTQSYSSNEEKLLKALGLEKLRNSAFWASILRSNKETAKDTIQQVSTSIQLARHYVPGIMSLTAPHKELVDLVRDEGEKVGVEYINLSVLIVEEEDLSTPKRLIFLLEAVQGLYDMVGRIQNKDTQDLYVINCESGDDKQFDFYGNAEIIEGVKEIILTLWDRVVFYRDDKTGKQLDLMVESIPILEQVTELERSGSLEKEEAEILRRLASSSAKKFSQAGVTIPEMEDAAKYDPRALMHPDRRILSAPEASGMVVVPDEDDPDEEDIPPNYRDLHGSETPEDLEEFIAPEPAAEPEVVEEQTIPETPVEPEKAEAVQDKDTPTWEDPEELVKPEEPVVEPAEDIAAAPETPEVVEPPVAEETATAPEPEVTPEPEPTENPFGDIDTPSPEPIVEVEIPEIKAEPETPEPVVEPVVEPETPEPVEEFKAPEPTVEPIVEPVVEVETPEPVEEFKTPDPEPAAANQAGDEEDGEELVAAEGIPSLEELIEADPAVEDAETEKKAPSDSENIYAKIAEEYLAKMRQDAADEGADDAEKD